MSSIPSSSVPLGNKRELEGDTLDSNAKRIKLDVPSSPEASSERVAAPSTALPTDMVDLVSARKALMEQDVGITAFIDPSLPGFIGILKSRYTDFQVNEVTLDGKIVHLESTDLPIEELEDQTSVEQEKDSETGFKQLGEIIKDDEFINQLRKMVDPKNRFPELSYGIDTPTIEPESGDATAAMDANSSHNGTELPSMEPEAVDAAVGIDTTTIEPESGDATAAMDANSSRNGTDSSSKELEVVDTAPNVDATPDTTPATDATRDLYEPLPSEPQIKSLKVNVPEKAVRTRIHLITKTHFGDVLDTQAVGKGDVEFRLWPSGPQKSKQTKRPTKGQKRGKDRQRKSKKEWLAEGGGYTEFTLYKENKDTIQAINTIGKLMGLNAKSFSYAGTKDKRAVTTQKVAVSRVPAKRLYDVNKILRGMVLGDFRPRKDQIRLGDLSGNHFKIALREVKVKSMETLQRAVNSLRDCGFVNYFGMQRFGTRSVPTYVVGIAYLKGDFQRAVEWIMDHKEGERDDFVKARQHWKEHQDAHTALKLFPKSCMAERAILSFFKKTGRSNDYYGALEAIPRNLRTMYLHSYQSLVWNNMVSERLKLYGPKPVVGDVVNVEKNNVDDGDEDVLVVPAQDEASGAGNPEPQGKKREIHVAIIETEEDLAKYSIDDVLLPLPGHSVKYPTHAIGQKYVEFMAQHGLDPHDMSRKQKTTNLPGSYRKIVAKPKDFGWKVIQYDDPLSDLMLTDMERLERMPEPKAGGARLGVILEFTLASSQYATMALRECMKFDTTAAYHEQWTQYYKQSDNAQEEPLPSGTLRIEDNVMEVKSVDAEDDKSEKMNYD